MLHDGYTFYIHNNQKNLIYHLITTRKDYFLSRWDLDYFQHILSRQAIFGLGAWQIIGVCHHKARTSGSVVPGSELTLISC